MDNRDRIKTEFKYYLANVARSSRRTSDGFNLGRTAVDSFLSFIETDRLFDYAPEKWSHIKSMYDITTPEEVKQIAEDLLNDKTFLKHDNAKNQGWRSGAISHYVCFINARSFFLGNQNTENHSYTTDNPLQQIFYGAPGTGKSNTIKREVDDKGMSNVRTTFHPDSDYSTFVGAYKPTSIEVPVMTIIGKEQVPVENTKPEKKIVYEFVPQAFLKAYTGAWKNQDKPFFLIIEEFNRGNCAQIFGDLFQLLDRNIDGMSEYPISPDEDIQKFLQTDKKYGFAELTEEQKAVIPAEILSGELMILPKNLHIWATMNTSDQSLFPIDSAFKRRWDWVYMPIGYKNTNWTIEIGDKKYEWVKFQRIINDKIYGVDNSEDKQLGDYFVNADRTGCKISADTFLNKILFYIWNDVCKDDPDQIFQWVNDKKQDENIKFSDFFGEKKVEMLQGFMAFHKIPEVRMEETGADANQDSNTSSNSAGYVTSKFSLNGGKPMPMTQIAKQVVSDYVAQHPTESGEQIRDVFNIPCKHIVVETEAEFTTRKETGEKTHGGQELVLQNGEKIYTSNQWEWKSSESSFARFIQASRDNGWGIIVEVTTNNE